MLPVCAEDGDDQFPLFVVMNILPWESRRSTFGGVIGMGNIDRKKDNVSRFDALFSSLTTRAGRANCCTAVEHANTCMRYLRPSSLKVCQRIPCLLVGSNLQTFSPRTTVLTIRLRQSDEARRGLRLPPHSNLHNAAVSRFLKVPTCTYIKEQHIRVI